MTIHYQPIGLIHTPFTSLVGMLIQLIPRKVALSDSRFTKNS